MRSLPKKEDQYTTTRTTHMIRSQRTAKLQIFTCWSLSAPIVGVHGQVDHLFVYLLLSTRELEFMAREIIYVSKQNLQRQTEF